MANTRRIAPLPFVYAVIRIDPDTMVKDLGLDDLETLNDVRKIDPKKYLVYVEWVRYHSLTLSLRLFLSYFIALYIGREALCFGSSIVACTMIFSFASLIIFTISVRRLGNVDRYSSPLIYFLCSLH